MNLTKTQCESEGNWQCTKYAYYRAYEVNGYYPCWYNGKGNDGYGKYRNAKLWKDHYRHPYKFLALGTFSDFNNYDVLVFDGKCGHVAFIEAVVNNDKLLVSDCNLVAPCTFSERYWNVSNKMSGTGQLLGILRCNASEPTTLKSNEEIAEEVINGKWGNYPDRKQKLQDAGYNYSDIQTIVNQKIYGIKTNEEIAKEVIAGKWGNYPYRKEALESRGYDYSAIQTIVNKMMKNK